MKKRFKLGAMLSAALIAFSAYATTSTINPAVPAQSSPLTSAPIRQNFTAAYNDINNIYSVLQNPSASTFLLKSANLSDVASASVSRSNLGLGTAAIQNIGTNGSTIPLLSTANTWASTQNFGAGATGNLTGTASAASSLIGNLPVTNLNSGLNASASTVWRGDGTWAPANGALIDPRDTRFGSNTCTGYYGIATSSLGVGGNGYAVGNTFTIAAATPGANVATGHITGVSSGVVTTYTIDTAGGAYNLATGTTLVTTATSGSGTGLTITINTASGTGHDDTTAINAALVYATSIGTGISAPTGCWISNLTTPVNSSITGSANAPTYGYFANNVPVWFIWGTPTFGVNFTNSGNISLTGFQVSGIASPSAFTTTACIGATGQGSLAGTRLFALNMAAHHCNVGLGTNDGTGGLLFVTSTSSDWGANNIAGIYGPFSDLVSLNDTFVSENNGIWLSSSSGGFAHITGSRIEYINQYGVRLDNFSSLQTQLDDVQMDRTAYCSIYTSSTQQINITGGAFKGTGLAGTLTVTGAANNGSGLIRLAVTGYGAAAGGGGTATSGLSTGDTIAVSGVGGTTEANGNWTLTVVDASHIDLQASTFTHTYTSGGLGGVSLKDAYICSTGTTDIHVSNLGFYGYSAGAQLAAAYLLDTSTSDRISVEGGSAQSGNGLSGSYQIAVGNYRGGTPSHLRINIPALTPFINDQSSFSFNTSGGMGLGTVSPNLNDVLDLSSSALALGLPTWTTGTRPTPTAGMIGYNTSTPGIEAYYGSAWNALGGGGGSGNMNTSTYDPAAIAQQVVGTTATQTVTNKTISGASNTLTVRLASDVTGNLPVTNLGSGTSASSSTFWRGDGVWATPSGSGGMSIGGSITSATAGSMLFAGASGVLAQDNANLFYDGTNHNLGLGTATPNATSILDLVSTTKSFGVPSMTTAQMNAISSPRDGSLVYINDATNGPYMRINSNWRSIYVPFTAPSFFQSGSLDFGEQGQYGSNAITLSAPNVSIPSSATNTLNANTGTILVGSGSQVYDTTITSIGTTGAQTINKPTGAVTFAAAATSLVVTDSLVTANSIVFATVRTNDTTATIKNVVPASGSFTINLNAAATAATSVGFFVMN